MRKQNSEAGKAGEIPMRGPQVSREHPEKIILRALSFFYTMQVSGMQSYPSDGASLAVALVECGRGPAAVGWPGGYSPGVRWRVGDRQLLGLTRFY